MVASKYFYYQPGEVAASIPVAFDPSRIAAQVVSGIGFLGAGVILKDLGSVHGLTTAATLGFNAGVGIACGAGMLLLPLFYTGIGLLSLTVMKQWEERIPRDSYRRIAVDCQEQTGPVLPALTQYFATRHIQIVDAHGSTSSADEATQVP
jgi:putative Mg2+ transporter-C (MgtC) family protein